MMNWWRARSTGWRDDGERKRRDQRNQDHVGAAVERERGTNVLRTRLAAAIAHRCVVDRDTAVDTGTGERKPERAGHRRFRPAGVRRAVVACVAPHRCPRIRCRRIVADGRGQNDQQRRQPRRRQVDQIVESCGGKPEVAVTRRAMADHAVGGVDRLVGRATGQAADRQPEHRRDDSVGEILREAFDRRPRDAGLVERVGIAPDDLRHRLAAAGEAFLFERRRDALDMVVEATLGNQRAGDEGNRH